MSYKQICEQCCERLQLQPRVSLADELPIEPCDECGQPTSSGFYVPSREKRDAANEAGKQRLRYLQDRTPYEAPAIESTQQLTNVQKMLANLRRGGSGGPGFVVPNNFYHGWQFRPEPHRWQVQRAMRIKRIAIWGAAPTAVLERVMVNDDNQIVGDIPCSMFSTEAPLSLMLKNHLVAVDVDEKTGTFESKRTKEDIFFLAYPTPDVVIKSASPGHFIEVSIRGRFDACALFAQELPE